jgi:Protein of unknown function (DUF2786)
VKTDADLERWLLDRLRSEWRHQNEFSFRGLMKAPAIELTDSTAELGAWVPLGRRMRLSRRLVLEQSWLNVIGVMRHEMAHQYCYEALGVRDESAHGPAFQKVCDSLGIDPGSRGMPLSSDGAEQEDRIQRRIRRLLALAQSSNEHEAEAAMQAAQRLMLQHNVAAASEPRRYTWRALGRPLLRRELHINAIVHLLTRHFFVEVLWIQAPIPERRKDGYLLEISGTPENLDIAEYVWHFVLETAERLWGRHPATSTMDRRSFYYGLVRGFLDKLDRQQVEHQQTGLIWRGDADLENWYHRRHPRIRRGGGSSAQLTSAYNDGRAEGERLVLHRPVTSGPSGDLRLLKG